MHVLREADVHGVARRVHGAVLDKAEDTRSTGIASGTHGTRLNGEVLPIHVHLAHRIHDDGVVVAHVEVEAQGQGLGGEVVVVRLGGHVDGDASDGHGPACGVGREVRVNGLVKNNDDLVATGVVCRDGRDGGKTVGSEGARETLLIGAQRVAVIARQPVVGDLVVVGCYGARERHMENTGVGLLLYASDESVTLGRRVIDHSETTGVDRGVGIHRLAEAELQHATQLVQVEALYD